MANYLVIIIRKRGIGGNAVNRMHSCLGNNNQFRFVQKVAEMYWARGGNLDIFLQWKDAIALPRMTEGPPSISVCYKEQLGMAIQARPGHFSSSCPRPGLDIHIGRWTSTSRGGYSCQGVDIQARVHTLKKWCLRLTVDVHAQFDAIKV